MGDETAVAEWGCPYCAARNLATDLNCRACGAPRTGPVPPPPPVRAPGSAPIPVTTDGAAPGDAESWWMGNGVRATIGGLLLAGLAAIAFSWADPVPVGGEDLVPAVVASRRAVRIVDVERRGPGGGWTTVRSVTAAAENEVPAWPVPTPRRRERAGGRTARYTVTYRRESGLIDTVAADSAGWAATSAGDHVALRLREDGTLGQVLSADSLAGCRRWHREPGYADPPDSVVALGCTR
ncbi:MAG TPA: hypothetical protein VFH27_02570 [Longimicrobiaceae bacterium]|nr:hypothetical protein [Longimicrobiaceae bacterium]